MGKDMSLVRLRSAGRVPPKLMLVPWCGNSLRMPEVWEKVVEMKPNDLLWHICDYQELAGEMRTWPSPTSFSSEGKKPIWLVCDN